MAIRPVRFLGDDAGSGMFVLVRSFIDHQNVFRRKLVDVLADHERLHRAQIFAGDLECFANVKYEIALSFGQRAFGKYKLDDLDNKDGLLLGGERLGLLF